MSKLLPLLLLIPSLSWGGDITDNFARFMNSNYATNLILLIFLFYGVTKIIIALIDSYYGVPSSFFEIFWTLFTALLLGLFVTLMLLMMANGLVEWITEAQLNR